MKIDKKTSSNETKGLFTSSSSAAAAASATTPTPMVDGLDEVVDKERALDEGRPFGRWNTSRGNLILRDEGEFFGKMVSATYPASNGRLDGFMNRTVEGKYRFEGTWLQTNYRVPYPCFFEFAVDGNSFEGKWNQQHAAGDWSGSKITDYHQRSAMGYSGLVNLGILHITSCSLHHFPILISG
jgi:hypothetical protein